MLYHRFKIIILNRRTKWITRTILTLMDPFRTLSWNTFLRNLGIKLGQCLSIEKY